MQAARQGFRGHDWLYGDLASILLRWPGAGSLETPQADTGPGAARALQDRA